MSSVTATWGRAVALSGLTTFNLDDRDFIVTSFDGWESTAKPAAVFVANGGGPGGVASGDWLAQEKYLTLSGAIMADYATQATYRAALLAAVPADADTAVVVYGWPGEEDLQAFVRLYDAPEIVRSPGVLEFSLPLLQLDPYKYAMDEISGSLGVFTGASWLESFALNTNWVETYTLSSGSWVETFTPAASTGSYPASVSLTSDGTVTSRRVTASVYGPLTAGNWYLLHENSGRQQRVQVSVAAGQTLTMDCANWAADIDGADVSYLMYGDPLLLEPGVNTYRLVSNTVNTDAYATITALPAYE